MSDQNPTSELLIPDYATAYRSHTCGQLDISLVGQAVKLCGVVDRHGAANQFVLRDTFGEVLVFMSEQAVELLESQLGATEATLESVVQVEGTLEPQPDSDHGFAVDAEAVQVISIANSPLLFDFRSPEVSRWDRIRFRYLSLRDPELQRSLAFRTQLVHRLRSHLVKADFDELDFPILNGRYVDDTGRGFLAIRGAREVFALPGKNPQHSSLVMASGFDRTFEVGRRFERKEKYGPFEQPEYTVLDMGLAFVDYKGLLDFNHSLLQHLWQGILGHDEDAPIIKMSHAEARQRFGSGRPDLRCQLEILNADEMAASCQSWKLRQLIGEGGALRAIRIPRAGRRLSRLGSTESLGNESLGLVVHAFRIEDGADIRVLEDGSFDPALAKQMARAVRGQFSDLVLVVEGPSEESVSTHVGELRSRAATAFEIFDLRFAFGIITDVPMGGEPDSEAKVPFITDPMCMPLPSDRDSEPQHMRGQCFEVILNGIKVGGGHIRHHQLSVLRSQLRKFGYSGIDIDGKFGTLLEALQYGTPPHGRVAYGVERLAALLQGQDSIDEVIAMPKVWDGTDPLVRSPWPIEQALLKGLLGV